MTPPRHLVAIALCWAAASSSPLAAQTSSRPDSAQEPLPEILVTANARNQDPLEVPWSAALLGREVLEAGPRSLPEALRGLPSVMIQKTAYGQSSPYIRGFTGFRTLMLVDGIPLNHAAMRSGPNQYWSTVDMGTVERVELVRGPSSVLYGSDAIGGTVNAITKRTPRGAANSGFQAGGSLFTRYASAEDSYIGRAELRMTQDDRWSLLGGFSLKDFNDLQGGRDTGVQPMTGYEEHDGDLRLDRFLDSGVQLTLAGQTDRQIGVPRTHKTIFAQSYDGTSVGKELKRDQDQVRDLVYGRAEWEEGGGWMDHATLTLSWQRHYERRDRLRTGGKRDLQGTELHDFGLQARFESETLASGHWSWGFEAHRQLVDSFRDNFKNGVYTGSAIQGPVADNSTYTTIAAYLQDELNWEDWSLVPGIRYTRAALHAGRVEDPVTGLPFSFSDSWNAVVGSLRGMRWLGPDSNLYAGLSQGFRAPNLSDTTAFDATSAVEVPSANLSPEYFLQAELGTKGRTRHWVWQAAAYRTWIQDMIVQSPTGTFDGSGTPFVRKDNVGDGWINGVELELRYRWTEAWSTGVSGSWTDGKVDQLQEPGNVVVRRPISRLMPLSATVDIDWRDPDSSWWGNAWAWMVDRQDQLALRDVTDTSRIPPGGTPGFSVFGLSVGTALSDRADLSFSVDNLFDRDYRVHGSGLNGPGRNLIWNLELRF